MPKPFQEACLSEQDAGTQLSLGHLDVADGSNDVQAIGTQEVALVDENHKFSAFVIQVYQVVAQQFEKKAV